MAYKFNDLQKTASAICGYEPFESFSSAKNDYYYELETKEQRIEFIISLSESMCGEEAIKKSQQTKKILSNNQALKVYEFLESDDDMSSNDRYYKFIELKPSNRNIKK